MVAKGFSSDVSTIELFVDLDSNGKLDPSLQQVVKRIVLDNIAVEVAVNLLDFEARVLKSIDMSPRPEAFGDAFAVSIVQ
ncbi:hypothetical protein L484_011763 [Morus notabilis]|uniref:Uncharacterized protein n=1 Tax=Morus notabilis TaxID=981085 RepID=W9SSP4_9ROSA|nr:hypothetical protein L484_011763 [Morus notabilis]